ncbi:MULTISPECIES: hypothetical protein [Ochrobactrum]|uniref:hypothetical protein n=1 Tax=Ochrobactrum TaxID=528 RepID=UPI001783FECB|nr:MULTISPECIES: hypothetical protein [Brucella/Ochrobactrum group]MBD7991870.1 hypothetical protein [Ochrobactrum gallinarum]MDH7792425.1 hypothetical protein [Ochrobactrum sp. AN78]
MGHPILIGRIASDVGVSTGGIWSQAKSALDDHSADGVRFSAHVKRYDAGTR